MTTVQMNTRIDAGLKSAGDAVLESVGYTPTRAVRAIWGFACRNKGNTEAVEELLREAEGIGSSEADMRARKIQLAETGPSLFEGFMKQMGIDEIPKLGESVLSAAEAREHAAVERAVRKGLVHE